MVKELKKSLSKRKTMKRLKGGSSCSSSDTCEGVKKEGYFEAKYSLEGKIFYIKINFNFENKTATYSSSLTDAGGYKAEFILPKEKFNIEMEWSGIMAFGKNKIPIVSAIEKLCKISPPKISIHITTVWVDR